MAEEALEQLVAAIQDHYQGDNPPPLLLSTFGQRHKDLLTALKQQFGTLKGAVQAAGEHRIRFVDTTIGREAVAPADIAADVQLKVQETSASQRDGAARFDCLPQPVKLAFTIRLDQGELIAVDTVRPFRFAKITEPDLLRPTQRIIADKYRRPGLSLRSATAQDREGLWRQFLAWAEEVGVDPATFQQRDATTALARLIAAQPADIVPRLVIPADIASILLKRS